ncbi:hypothetical protein V1522DRAFT_433319 [Lipomyces starkeyi]
MTETLSTVKGVYITTLEDYSYGQCERWAECHISQYPNFGISATSRVEGSHTALKELSVVSANENLFVRVDIMNQIETSMLCTAISRSGLELEENGTIDRCSCTIQLGLPLEVAQIHPRWRVQVSLPVVDVPNQTLDASVLSRLKDPVVLLKRKGRPRGTRRLQTAEKVRLCGSCHKAGHNRRSCPKLRARSTAMHKRGTILTEGISDIDGPANQQPNAVDNNDLDEDIDGEEDDEFVPEFQKRYSRWLPHVSPFNTV